MIKIVSGGQTGVDRAALDAALSVGVEAGGWCPAGRTAEDGPIPERYPVVELPGAGYRERTKQNIIDSDGTVIIYFGYPSGGTELTIRFCMERHQPYLLIDAAELNVDRAAARLTEFVQINNIATLNVAGPRASGEPRAYDYATSLLASFLNST